MLENPGQQKAFLYRRVNTAAKQETSQSCYAREGMTCGQFESRCSNKRRKQSLERGTGGNAHKSRDSSYFVHRMEWGIERENLKEVGSELEAAN